MDATPSPDYDVVIIGAGISGINLAYRLQEQAPFLSYTILEGRHEIGGTWSLFKYPGIRSDSDLYTFGFPWRPWITRSSIAEGPLIREYMKSSASMYGIDKKIQFQHRVDKANWSSTLNYWTFDVTANKTESKTITGRFLMFCTGYYDYERALPSTIPGIDNFQGKVIHPQFWPEDLNYEGKKVVIIGSGATAVTLLPSMADKAEKVTMLQRSPSYVVSLQQEDAIERFIRRWFRTKWQHQLIRWKHLFIGFALVRFCMYMPNAARKLILKGAEMQLPKSIPVDPDFTPRYNPFEQRLCLCPNADFYKCLRSGKADVVTGVIDTVAEKSIRLTDGRELHPDIIVTATGLKVMFGGGVNVTVDDKPYDPANKLVWKGAMLQNLPNAAFFVGYVDASWTLGADATAQMMCRLFKHMRAKNELAVIPRCSEKEESEMQKLNLFRLSSTYLKHAQGKVPQAGDRGQWLRRNYYYRDILTAWFGDIMTNLERIRAV